MKVIEQLTSRRGVPVTIERHQCPDAKRVPYIAVRYGNGQAPGAVAYYLETEACVGPIELVRDWFLDDSNNLVQPFDSRPKGNMWRPVVVKEGQEVKPPLRTIRAFCLNCMENATAVRNCSADGRGGHEACPFHPYRFGKKPGTGSRSRLKVIREYCL